MRNEKFDQFQVHKIDIDIAIDASMSLLEDTQKLLQGDYQAVTVRTTAKLETILDMFVAELMGLNTQIEEEINSYHIPPNKP